MLNLSWQLRLKRDRGLRRIINSLILKLKPPQRIEFSKINKILLIRCDRIGDAVVTTPLIKEWKRRYPNITLFILASRNNAFVFEDNPHIDHTFVLNTGKWFDYNLSKYPLSGPILNFVRYFLLPLIWNRDFRDLIKELRRERIDLSIDLIGKRRCALLGKIVSKWTIGCQLFCSSWLYTYYSSSQWVSPYDKEHILNKYVKTINEALGIRLDVSNLPAEVFLDEIDSDNPFLFKHKRFILFHTGGSSLRQLEIDKIMDIIRELSKDYRIVVIEEPQVKGGIKEVFQNCKDVLFAPEGLALQEIAMMAKRALLFIGHDSGALHYISTQVRTLGIYGPGSAQIWAPWDGGIYYKIKNYPDGVEVYESNGKYRHRVIYLSVRCSPCFDIGCPQRCCISSIKVGYIIENVREMLHDLSPVTEDTK